MGRAYGRLTVLPVLSKHDQSPEGPFAFIRLLKFQLPGIMLRWLNMNLHAMLQRGKMFNFNWGLFTLICSKYTENKGLARYALICLCLSNAEPKTQRTPFLNNCMTARLPLLSCHMSYQISAKMCYFC
jgi:hypothetical protein